MKCVIQRVSQASVTIHDLNTTREIKKGLLIYLGISKEGLQTIEEKIDRFIKKVTHLQLFSDETGKISQSLETCNGSILLISNFTLHGRNKKGTQIDFGKAAGYKEAEKVYNTIVSKLQETGIDIQTGEFGASMSVSSIVEGPVNFIWDL